ncbi:MAG: NADAR family protein [Lachnospiraceae bacterium]|nr:NADAR family protein [Lachnospiraceae bacterium]
MITEFQNEYFFLSNFYPCEIIYKGVHYHNAEAAFQAQKCSDDKGTEQFAPLNASAAKKLGRSVTLRHDWELIKVQEMSAIVHEKFKQNPDIRQKLLNTGSEYLEEGNTWGDRTWGTVNGSGANLLGRILMSERDRIKEAAK